MNVGDKFRVKNNSQWPGQSLWIGHIEKISDDGKYIHAYMNTGLNFYGSDNPEKFGQTPISNVYFYYASDIEIIADDIFDPEFSLEEIELGEKLVTQRD